MSAPNRSPRRDLVVAISLALLSSTVVAQEVSEGALEEIVVTAQKRSESIQDVPVSITALSATQLAEARIEDPSALTAYVPNLQASAPLGGSTPVFSLRGVSMSDYSLNQSSPVASYVDEVYKGNFALFGVQMYDLDRIEVLRGPQGTLYGKNTTGGAINFVTRRPDFDNDGYLRLGIGSDNRTEAQGAMGGSLVEDRLAGRIAFTYAKADGWFQNRYPGGENPEGLDEYGVRASLLYKPTDSLDVMLRLATSEQTPINYGVFARPGESGIGGGVYSLFHSFDPVANPNVDYFRTGLDDREIESNFARRRRIATDSAALTLDWKLSDGYALTSITSWDKGEMLSPEDADGSPLKVIEIDYDAPDVRQYTQDLRITSTLGGRFDFIAGLYVGREKLTNSTELRLYNDIDVNFDGALDFQDCLAGLPLGCAIGNSFEQERDTWAVYFDGSYELTDSLKLRFGVRETHDQSKLRDFKSQLRGSDGVVLANLIPGDPANPDATTSDDFSNDAPSGKLGLDYTTANGTLLYASYSHGYRGGAFNAQAFFAPDELTVADPEKLDAYEIGAKGQFAGGRVQLNGAAFVYKYKDQQFLDTDASTSLQVLRNIDQSTIKGMELELIAKATDALTLTGGLGWLDSRVDQAELRGEDLSGNELPLAPKLTATLGVDWQTPISPALRLALHADGSYAAKQYFDIFDTERLANDAYTLVNARVALQSADARWEVAAWGKNLSDEFYFTYGLETSFGFDYFHVGAPRSYGIEASWRF
jgi:iron complex outermembrane receptor protein